MDAGPTVKTEDFLRLIQEEFTEESGCADWGEILTQALAGQWEQEMLSYADITTAIKELAHPSFQPTDAQEQAILVFLKKAFTFSYDYNSHAKRALGFFLLKILGKRYPDAFRYAFEQGENQLLNSLLKSHLAFFALKTLSLTMASLPALGKDIELQNRVKQKLKIAIIDWEFTKPKAFTLGTLAKFVKRHPACQPDVIPATWSGLFVAALAQPGYVVAEDQWPKEEKERVCIYHQAIVEFAFDLRESNEKFGMELATRLYREMARTNSARPEHHLASLLIVVRGWRMVEATEWATSAGIGLSEDKLVAVFGLLIDWVKKSKNAITWLEELFLRIFTSQGQNQTLIAKIDGVCADKVEQVSPKTSRFF